MSGAGRKHRAKHLTQQYLDVSGWVGPKEGERLAVCLESPHGQHVRVLLLLGDMPSTQAPLEQATKILSSRLPSASVREAVGDASASPPTGSKELPTSSRSEEEEEQLVHLPRKFHKVIWLGIKDIVIIADRAVRFKPSPEQLENFFKDPANAGWRERVALAQQRAEVQRTALQRMPQYGATIQTTTSVLRAPQVHQPERPRVAQGSDEDAASDDDLVNPNRCNLKHQQQFFYGVDDDAEEEGDEEEEEEEEDAV